MCGGKILHTTHIVRIRLIVPIVVRRAITVRVHVPRIGIGCTRNRGPVIAIRETKVTSVLNAPTDVFTNIHAN